MRVGLPASHPPAVRQRVALAALDAAQSEVGLEAWTKTASEDEAVERTGLLLAELRARSFVRIAAGRRG